MALAEAFKDIRNATAALEEVNKAALGLRKVYVEPPDSLEQFPCSVRYTSGPGTLRHSRGLGQDNIYRWVIEVHHRRAQIGGLQFVDREVTPFIERFQELYAQNLSLTGTCDVSGFGNSPDDAEGSYEFFSAEWNGVKTLGVRFNMWAKYMLAPITVDL